MKKPSIKTSKSNKDESYRNTSIFSLLLSLLFELSSTWVFSYMFVDLSFHLFLTIKEIFIHEDERTNTIFRLSNCNVYVNQWDPHSGPKKKKGNIDSNIFEPTCFKYRQIEVNTTTSWGRTEQRTGSSKAFTVKYKGNKHLLGQTKKEVDVIKVET